MTEIFMLSLQIWTANVSPIPEGYEYKAQQMDSLTECQTIGTQMTDIMATFYDNNTTYMFKCVVRQGV